MKINKLNIALLLGLMVITGILIVQFFLLRQAVQFEEKKFAQKVHVALLEVAGKLNADSKTALQQSNPIEKVKDDYYIVNVNGKFEPASLEFYLRNEFDKFDLVTDFEYGMYDCSAEKMKYGKYISVTNNKNNAVINFTPSGNGLVYYFAVHFPQKSSYIYKSLKIWIVLSFVMLIVLVLYGYSAFTILQQKKYSELQKDFINNMTHEFKTPISSILISSTYLAHQQPIVADEKLKKYTGLISQQATKLNNHVEKILNLARTENKSIVLQKSSFNVVPAIQLVIDNIKLKYPDVEVALKNESDACILADEFHFSNLVYNLLDNAVKYSCGIPSVSVVITGINRQISISFIDKGIGIPAKHQQNVFEKFYRIPDQKGNEVIGFGLGLFYVKRICKEHKWTLSLQSRENNGTEITVLIPANE
jgi:two-component system phosphate regulon sensor histidine kinase PhoR